MNLTEFQEKTVSTEIGDMKVTVRNGIMFCNFVGNEDKAKTVFGHWKVNAAVSSNRDVQNHYDLINLRIEGYKKALRNGIPYYRYPVV